MKKNRKKTDGAKTRPRFPANGNGRSVPLLFGTLLRPKNPGGEPFDPEVPPHLLFRRREWNLIRRRQGRKSQLRMVTEGTASPFNAPVITSTAACIEAATAP